MISIQEFYNEFLDRHDFLYSDLDYLPNKYKHIKFTNIPEAWVCQIDHCLQKLCSINNIIEISQECGFLVVSGNVDETDIVMINKLDSRLKQLDIDLHSKLSEGIILH